MNNHQFDVLLIIGVVFGLNFITMKIVTFKYIPYGIRAILGGILMTVSLVLAASISTYGR